MWFFFNQEGVTTGSLYHHMIIEYRLSDRLGINHWFLVDNTEGCYERDMPAQLVRTRFYLVQVTSQTEVGWLCRSKAVSIHTMKSFHASVRYVHFSFFCC